MSALIFSVIIIIALGYFARTIYRRFGMLLKVAPVNRFDHIPERIKAVLVYAFGQKKFVQREPRPEYAHQRAARRLDALLHLLGLHASWRSRWSPCSRAASSPTSTCRCSTPHLLGGPYLLLKDLMEVAVLGGDRRRAVSLGASRIRRGSTASRRPKNGCAAQSHWEAYPDPVLHRPHHDRRHAVRRRPHDLRGGRPRTCRPRSRWQPFSHLVGLALAAIGGVGAGRSSSATSAGGCTTASSSSSSTCCRSPSTSTSSPRCRTSSS